MLFPLAAAQFLASYDTQAMNVAISDIVEDLDTTVTGVQTALSLFTLTMAALMIPGSVLTDILGRKRCFVMGVSIYAVGASDRGPVARARLLDPGLVVSRRRGLRADDPADLHHRDCHDSRPD